MKRPALQNKRVAVLEVLFRGLFLESPETFRAHFGWHNYLCIFKTKAYWGTKLCSYFYFYSLYDIWKDQVCRISRPGFYEWLFGPEKFSGLSRNGPQVPLKVWCKRNIPNLAFSPLFVRPVANYYQCKWLKFYGSQHFFPPVRTQLFCRGNGPYETPVTKASTGFSSDPMAFISG